MRGIVCLIQYVNGTYVSVVAKKQDMLQISFRPHQSGFNDDHNGPKEKCLLTHYTCWTFLIFISIMHKKCL